MEIKRCCEKTTKCQSCHYTKCKGKYGVQSWQKCVHFRRQLPDKTIKPETGALTEFFPFGNTINKLLAATPWCVVIMILRRCRGVTYWIYKPRDNHEVGIKMATNNTVFLLFCWISFVVAWSPRLLSPRRDNTKTSLPNEYSYETFYLDQQVCISMHASGINLASCTEHFQVRHNP